MKKQKKRYEGGLAMESKKIIEFRNIVKNFDGQKRNFEKGCFLL